MKIEIETFDDYSAKISLTILGETFGEVWSVLDENHLCTEGIGIEAQVAEKYPELTDNIGEILSGIDLEALCELHDELEICSDENNEE